MTPEERANFLMKERCIGHEDSWEEFDPPIGFVNDHYFITEQIRLAILQERKRCAELVRVHRCENRECLAQRIEDIEDPEPFI